MAQATYPVACPSRQDESGACAEGIESVAPLQRGPGPPGVQRRQGGLEGEKTHGRIGRRVFERKPGATDSLGEKSPEVETRVQSKVETHFRQRIVRMPSNESSPGAAKFGAGNSVGRVEREKVGGRKPLPRWGIGCFGRPIRVFGLVIATRFRPGHGGPA